MREWFNKESDRLKKYFQENRGLVYTPFVATFFFYLFVWRKNFSSEDLLITSVNIYAIMVLLVGYLMKALSIAMAGEPLGHGVNYRFLEFLYFNMEDMDLQHVRVFERIESNDAYSFTILKVCGIIYIWIHLLEAVVLIYHILKWNLSRKILNQNSRIYGSISFMSWYTFIAVMMYEHAKAY